MNFKAIVEGLLFVCGDEGLSLDEISKLIEKDKNETSLIIKELYNDYETNERGMRIEYLGNKFKLTTKSEHKDFYKKLVNEEQNSLLSQSSLETLAIIAYNEPITRVEIDKLRGVGSVQMVRKLVAKGFIKEVGRSDLPGRPILYETTSEFLDYFGLATIDDLPDMRDFLEENESVEEDNESDLYTSKYMEEVE